MKSIVFLLLLCGAAGASPAVFAMSAGETPAPSQKQGTKTEELVSAAKDAKTKRKKPSSKVITNSDVKKSKGKLIELPAKELAVAEKAPPVDRDLEYRQRVELEEKVAAAKAKVEDLEKALQDIEYRYYEESDPDRRDHVIRKRFEETKQELQTAREDLESLTPKSQEPTAQSPTP